MSRLNENPRLSRRRIHLPIAGLVGLGLVSLTVLVAGFAPLLAPHDPLAQNLSGRLLPPGSQGHLLGTDGLGRDLLSRIIYGARPPILVGASAVFIGAGLGGLLGMVSGYFGGWWDRLIMRLADIQLSLPAILLALTVIAVRGPQLNYLVGVLALALWPSTARVVRAQTLEVREREFVQAARTVGASSAYIIRKHVVRHVLGPLIVIATGELGLTILLAAALSFLGLGVQPPTPDWGGTLAEGREYMETAWWIGTFPGIALVLLVGGVNLVGDWLRDRLDPNIEHILMTSVAVKPPGNEHIAVSAPLAAPVHSPVDSY
jgi:peptide/nickel transport system permease protein